MVILNLWPLVGHTKFMAINLAMVILNLWRPFMAINLVGHKFSMTTARLSTCRVRITQRPMGFSTRITMSYLNESADLSVLSLASQVPGFKSHRQSGVNC